MIKSVMKTFQRLLIKKKLSRIKKSINMMKSQKSDTEKINLIEEHKRISNDEIIKCNEIINNNLKSQV